MKRKRSFIRIVGYGLLATMAISYGLLIRQSLLATFIAFHLAVCLGIPLIDGWREGTLATHWRIAWGEQSFDTAGLLLGIISGLSMGALAAGGIWLLLHSGISISWLHQQLEQWGLRDNWAWFFAIYMIIVNSLLEELFWRGFVQQRLLISLTRMKAIFFSNILFALYHLLIGVVLFGWKWGRVM